MKQRNLIDYTVWLQQKGFIKSDVVIEALTSEYTLDNGELIENGNTKKYSKRKP